MSWNPSLEALNMDCLLRSALLDYRLDRRDWNLKTGICLDVTRDELPFLRRLTVM